MSELTKTLKRFIICYKKEIDGKITKQPPSVVSFENERVAIEKTCNKFNIPIRKIGHNDNKEGYIYCNKVYNPRIDEDE